MNALRLGKTLLRRLAGDDSAALDRIEAGMRERRSAPAISDRQLLERLEIGVRELRAMMLAQSMPAPNLWQSGPRATPALPNTVVFDRSVICRQEHFETGYFAYWTAQIAHAPFYHRKLWEFVFIAQALHERGLLRDDSKGLGFGVGNEPLTALFASRGCEITATDVGAEQALDAGWIASAQHAANLDGLRRPQICDDEMFTRKVQFAPFDMTQTPGSFRGYDFCWSACALEHLGSIEAGLDFIRRSLECLRPGGVAVHTTEFNLQHDELTLDNAATVLFRRRDFESLFAALRAEGHLCAALDLDEGHQPVERYIDMPPFRSQPHLKLALEGFATTSIGLIVHRRAD